MSDYTVVSLESKLKKYKQPSQIVCPTISH